MGMNWFRDRRRARLLTFSGVDCSGKSTQIELLKRAVAADHGAPVWVFWYRPGYSTELDFLRAGIRKLRPRAIPGPGDDVARQQAFARRSVSSIWVGIAIVDLLFQYGIKVRAARSAGVTVICDRYLDDAFIDLKLRFPQYEGELRPVKNWCERLCPAPDLSVLLTLPEKIAVGRAAEKREPYPDTPEIRSTRCQAYWQLAASHGILVVDSTQSIEEVHSIIRAAELNHQGGRTEGAKTCV